MLRDEILYYGFIASLSVATNILMYLRNKALGPILAPLAVTLSALMVFHMVINLRSAAREPLAMGEEGEEEEEPISMQEILASTRVREPLHPSNNPQPAPRADPADPPVVSEHSSARDSIETSSSLSRTVNFRDFQLRHRRNRRQAHATDEAAIEESRTEARQVLVDQIERPELARMQGDTRRTA